MSTPADDAASPHHSLVALWGLRLLAHGLEQPAGGGLLPRPSPSPDLAEIDELMGKLGRRRKSPPVRGRSGPFVPLVERAAEVAGLLGLPFDSGTDHAVDEIRRVLRRQVRGMEASLAGIDPLDALAPEVRTGLAALARMLDLPRPEQLCLAFLVLLATEDSLESSANTLGHELDDRAADRAIAAATGLRTEEVTRVFLGTGRLLGCQLIKRDRNSLRLAGKFDWTSRNFPRELRLPDFDPLRAMRDRVVPAPPPRLEWSRFAHLGELRDLVRAYAVEALAGRRAGVNFLLHGPPGTGKTELVRALARELGCELYEVSTEDGDGDPIGGIQRLQALRLVQEFTRLRRSMVVFDEIEDVFPKPHPLFGVVPRQVPVKGWVNRMLEQNPTPTCWVTNAVEALDPAFVRRFDVVLEVKAPPAGVREAQLRDLPVTLPPGALARLAGCPELTAGVIQRAAAVVGTVAATNPALDPVRHLELLVNQTLRAQGHGGLKPALVPGEIYDPTCVNADIDPQRLVEGLRAVRAGRVCLFGPPGTGKTAFAIHLARELGLELLTRRASDLLGPYVGMSERLIAGAFREAEESGAALLIDEVDSFLQDRSRAQRGWEVTQVNEFLTQLERFPGLFVASTNLLEGFDPAALRRFDLKARFGYLRPEQARRLLRAHLSAAGLAEASPPELARLDRLELLTPGDFALVARQWRFRGGGGPGEWIGALESECRLKPGRSRPPIGFGSGA